MKTSNRQPGWLFVISAYRATSGSASSSDGLPLAKTRAEPSSLVATRSILKSFANGGRSSGPGWTTTLNPRDRYLSATKFSRWSRFMASLWQWERVYRVFDPHVDELIAGLPVCSTNLPTCSSAPRKGTLPSYRSQEVANSAALRRGRDSLPCRHSGAKSCPRFLRQDVCAFGLQVASASGLPLSTISTSPRSASPRECPCQALRRSYIDARRPTTLPRMRFPMCHPVCRILLVVACGLLVPYAARADKLIIVAGGGKGTSGVPATAARL